MKKASKRFYIFMVVVLSVLLSLGTTAAAASHPFNDVKTTYDEAVGHFYNAGVIKGKSNTEFGTYDSLKRGDAAVILSKVLGLSAENAPDAGFKDVNSRIKGHVNALVQAGVIKGFSDTVFSPDTHLTRGQMAALLVRAFDLKQYAKTTPFTDLSASFKGDIEALYGAGITGGISAAKYGTNEIIKRGDFAVLLYRTLNRDAELEVKAVKDVNPIHVPMGARLADLNLPQEVEVVYIDNTTGKKKVEWDTSALNLGAQDVYAVPGIVEDTLIKATVKVYVHVPELDTPRDFYVAKGTGIADIILPDKVKLTYHENKTEYRSITWDLSNLNLNKEGVYVVSGKIERIPIKHTMRIIVSDITVEKLPDIIAAKGSKLEDVKLPTQVKLTYTDGTIENRYITWDTSGLNLNQAGEYVLKGSISGSPWYTRMKVIVTDQVYPDRVELNTSELTLLEGTSLKLTATLTPAYVVNKNLTWSTTNKNVATVDQTGKVTAVAKGYAAIIVTTANGKTDAVNVTVVDDYIPYLEVGAKAGAIEDNLIKVVNFSIKNKGESSVLLEKIEIYDNGELDKILKKEDFEEEGITSVIKANETRNMSYSWSRGFNRSNSYVKFYFSLDGESYRYTRNL